MLFTLEVKTSKRVELIDITNLIYEKLKLSGVENGLCTIYTPHTTCAITINENADPAVKSDIIKFLNEKIPQNFPFKHYEGNSDAHIKSSLVGCSEAVIIENKKLLLGTWQGIYFCEFDGPRVRKIYVKFH
ncbi:YjbQ family protein [Deferribacteraceae bacterium V6Fe1]|nr:YjbQ family protein [Deferribacteraceae bacterium V6Fe1]